MHGRSELLGAWFVRFAWLFVIFVLLYLLAIRLWSVVLSLPSVEVLEVEGSSVVLQDLSSRHYFGLPAQSGERESKAYQLLGVMAGKPGLAVFRLASGESRAVREGEEIEPGVRLGAVSAEEIVIERQGVQSTIRLPKK